MAKKHVQFDIPCDEEEDVPEPELDHEMLNELKDLRNAKEAGVSYVMGRAYVKATKSSSWVKRVVIDIGYSFLQSNCREPAMALHIPHTSLIEVGMAYYV